MKEELLHYIWKYKLYAPEIYVTMSGERLEIIHPGLHNKDAGPDFFNAKVRIGDTLWAGNVEIHNKSSDWIKHGHHQDKNYDNVILHVVNQHDSETVAASGNKIPVWIMPINQSVCAKYQELQANTSWIPCATHLEKLSSFETQNWIDRMMVEKMEQKTEAISQLLTHTKNDWEEVFYVLLSRNFGFGINNEACEMMARNTPWRILLKNIDNRMRLEAILLGQAGFLDELLTEDDFISSLQKEYRYVAHKYGLKPMYSHQWKFLRLRPSNFPTVRLVQLANLLHKGKISLSRIIEANNIKELTGMLDVKPSPYWLTHYRPGAASPEKDKNIGQNSRELIIINTIAPITFAYGKLRGNENLCQKAIEWLEKLKPEQNSIIDHWLAHGMQALNAAQSQALVHLERNYCRHKRCLHCRIGHLVLSSS